MPVSNARRLAVCIAVAASLAQAVSAAAGDTIWIAERGTGKAVSIPMPK